MAPDIHIVLHEFDLIPPVAQVNVDIAGRDHVILLIVGRDGSSYLRQLVQHFGRGRLVNAVEERLLPPSLNTSQNLVHRGGIFRMPVLVHAGNPEGIDARVIHVLPHALLPDAERQCHGVDAVVQQEFVVVDCQLLGIRPLRIGAVNAPVQHLHGGAHLGFVRKREIPHVSVDIRRLDLPAGLLIEHLQLGTVQTRFRLRRGFDLDNKALRLSAAHRDRGADRRDGIRHPLPCHVMVDGVEQRGLQRFARLVRHRGQLQPEGAIGRGREEKLAVLDFVARQPDRVPCLIGGRHGCLQRLLGDVIEPQRDRFILVRRSQPDMPNRVVPDDTGGIATAQQLIRISQCGKRRGQVRGQRDRIQVHRLSLCRRTAEQ